MLQQSLAWIIERGDDVHVQQWISGVRCSLKTTVLTPKEEFAKKFAEMLTQLKTHDFLSKQQAQYFRELKSSLSPQEAVVVMDFAENYSFILQHAPQSHHLVNAQATVNPVIYFIEQGNNRGDVSVRCFAIISDSLDHTTVAVHVFQCAVLQVVKQDMPQRYIIFLMERPRNIKTKNF